MSIYDDMAQMFLARQQAQQQIPYQLGQPVQQLQQQPYSYQNLLKTFDLMRSMSQPSRQPRQPIMGSDGVLEVNPMTQEEIDYVNHPSVKWIKEHDEQGRLLSELPDPWEGGPETVTGPSLYNQMPSQEYQKHMRIVGELAKRNPKVRIAAGIGYEPMARPTDQPVSVIPLMENTEPSRTTSNSLSVF